MDILTLSYTTADYTLTVSFTLLGVDERLIVNNRYSTAYTAPRSFARTFLIIADFLPNSSRIFSLKKWRPQTKPHEK